MPIPIKAPTGDIVNFPDGTSDAVIEAAMSKEYPRTSAAAPAVPAPEGAAPADYANATDLTKTWLSQNPDRAGGLSHVVGESYRGLKEGFGDAPLAAPVPDWISKNVPNEIPVAAAYQLGNLGLRSLGGIMGGIYGAAKGGGEVLGMDPTQARKFGRDIEEIPLSNAGVSHTISRMPRNLAKPGVVEDFVARAKASPVPAMMRTAVNAVRGPGSRAKIIANNLRSALGPEAVAAADLAAQDAAMQAVANEQIVKALKAQTPFDIGNIGETALPHEIGSPLQEAGTANEATMVKARFDLDSQLRKTRNDMNFDLEKNGILPENMPAYQELEAKIQPVVSPNPATAPRIVAQNDPGVKRVYQRIADTVFSKEVPLTEEQVAEAKAAGLGDEIIARPVSGTGGDTRIIRDGVETQYPPQTVQYFRKFSNSFDAIDDARRFLGKVFSGRPPEGYEAISGEAHKELYALLDKLEKQYAGKAQTALQNNWSSATKKLAIFDTKAGKLLTDTQGETGIMKTSPSEIPKKFFGKGPDVYQSLIDVTGNPALVKRQVTKHMASELAGKTGEQATKVAKKYADMLSHPSLTDLKSKVEANVNSKNLAEIGNEARQAEVATAEGKLTAANKTAAAAEDWKNESRIRAKVYEGLNPRKAVSKAESDLTADRKAGRISEEQFNDSIDKVRKAQKLFGYSTKLKIALGGIVLATAVRGPVGREAIKYVINSGL